MEVVILLHTLGWVEAYTEGQDTNVRRHGERDRRPDEREWNVTRDGLHVQS